MIEARSEFDKKNLMLSKSDQKNGAKTNERNPDVLKACENWKNKIKIEDNIKSTHEESDNHSLISLVSSHPMSIEDSTAPNTSLTVLTPVKKHADSPTLDSSLHFSDEINNSSYLLKSDLFKFMTEKKTEDSYKINSPLYQFTPEKNEENILISSSSKAFPVIKNDDDSFSIVLESPEKFNLKTKKPPAEQKIECSNLIIDKKKDEYVPSVPDVKTFNKNITDNKVPDKRKIVLSEPTVIKKRGKYLTACSDIQALHDNMDVKKKTIIRKKKNIIGNGGKKKSRTVNKRQYMLHNTCGFDSLCEIFSFGYLNFKNFKNFIDSQCQSKCFFASVINYAKSGALAPFYQKRIELLFTLYPTRDGIIDCADDINSLMHRLFNKFRYNSSITEFICTNHSCKKKTIKKFATLSVSAKKIWERGINKLQDSVIDTLRRKSSLYCKSCLQNSVEMSTFIDLFLCLDISHFYVPSASLAKLHTKQRLTENLGSMPTKLKILDKNYLLFGVVEFVPPLFLNKIGHYVAYTRSINNNWVEINDLDFKCNSCNPKSTNIHISLLFYVLI